MANSSGTIHESSTHNTSIKINLADRPDPHTEVEFVVTPRTSWAKGPKTFWLFHTAGSEASPPTNLRAFIDKTSEDSCSLDLRFGAPEQPNGVISNYVIELLCIQLDSCKRFSQRVYTTNTTRLKVDNLPARQGNAKVFVSVRAENKADRLMGEAATTEVEICSQKPAPNILVKNNRGFTVVDTDLEENLLQLPFPQQVRPLTKCLESFHFSQGFQAV